MTVQEKAYVLRVFEDFVGTHTGRITWVKVDKFNNETLVDSPVMSNTILKSDDDDTGVWCSLETYLMNLRQSAIEDDCQLTYYNDTCMNLRKDLYILNKGLAGTFSAKFLSFKLKNGFFWKRRAKERVASINAQLKELYKMMEARWQTLEDEYVAEHPQALSYDKYKTIGIMRGLN